MAARYHGQRKSNRGGAVAIRDMPPIGEIEQWVTPLRLGISASELHGAITGFVCGCGTVQADDWLQTLQLQSADAALAGQARGALADLAATTAAAIGRQEPDLELLLPASEDGLEARARGLVDWCRGFLGGFGLAGIDAGNMEPGINAVLGDFSDIATTVPELGDRDEDQAALDELVNHVRFGAMLLHARLTVPDGVTRQ